MARFRAFTSDSENDSSSEEESTRTSSVPPSNVKHERPPSRAYSYSAHTSSGSDEDEPEEPEDPEEQIENDDSYMEEEIPTDVSDAEPEGSIEKTSTQPTPWAQQLNLEPHRVHVMQTSLFRVPELTRPLPSQKTNLSNPGKPQRALGEAKGATNRTSFTQSRSQPPPRKYVRVDASASATASYEGVYLDSGLSLGRSFRVGWGPDNKLVHVGQLCSPNASSSGANSSTVHVTTLQHSIPVEPDLLQHLLSYTEIDTTEDENERIPFATPKRTVAFSTFSTLFEAQDRSHAASVFRLGHALFDAQELYLGKGVSDDIRNRIRELRRTDALSSWLARTVASSVEKDIKEKASSDSAMVAFLYLTGNQVENAVEALINGGNMKLATLISQVPGDAEFRADIRDQLQVWKEEKVDGFISQSIRKLYALAAGEVDVLEGSTRKEDVDVPKDLDWLRVFGLQLWFSSMLGTPLHQTFEVYEQFIEDAKGKVGFPTPWYSKRRTGTISATKDGLFNLIKLSLSPSMTLENTLNPLSFSPNPRDYRVPWLLYIILSRALRIRDFTDRQLSDAMDEDGGDRDIDGYSQVANILTANYATQLQEQGLIQEAVFVLLFLEDDAGRKRAVKELLSQTSPILDQYTEAGLKGSLKIPSEWIEEAKATHALYLGDVYLAYELYTRARVHKMAHELAITYLAPEAVLRDDLDLLSNLFTVLDESLVEDFGVGGQLFIDYAHIVSRIPDLRESLETEDAVPDAAESSELEMLSGRIPKLIGVLPDVLHDKPGTGDQCKAALSHMLSRLLDCVDPSVPTKVEIEPGLVDEAARLKHIHASAYGSFMRTIAELA